MNDLIEEVMEEQQDLEFRLYKLAEYLDKNPKVSNNQLNLLRTQKQIMQAYSAVLSARINDLRWSK